MRGPSVSNDMTGPDWVLVHQTSGRRDFRMYLLLAFGLVFVFAGATIDPATNCDSSGECAPWLVPVAFWIGVLASVGGLMGIIRNPRRGSRIHVRTGELMWWNEVHASASGRLMLSEVGAIKVDTNGDSSSLKLLDRSDQPLPFPGVEVVPSRLEAWARDVAKLHPHIRVDVV